jgi:hypothetical protein
MRAPTNPVIAVPGTAMRPRDTEDGHGGGTSRLTASSVRIGLQCRPRTVGTYHNGTRRPPPRHGLIRLSAL